MEELDKVVELQRRWIKIRSANLYDTLDKMGYPNQCLSLEIKPIVPGARIAGRAVTMRGIKAPYTMEEIESNKEELDPPFETIQARAYPGCVVVIDGGGERISGKCGEMTSWAFKQKGATGIVVDGYIRDYEGLVEIPGYTVCAKGTAPIESKQRWMLKDFGAVIGMPGTLTATVRVRPGDWIVGDSDGVIVVPQEIAEDALAKAEEIELSEEGMRADMKNGMPFEDAYKKWGRA